MCCGCHHCIQYSHDSMCIPVVMREVSFSIYIGLYIQHITTCSVHFAVVTMQILSYLILSVAYISVEVTSMCICLTSRSRKETSHGNNQGKWTGKDVLFSYSNKAQDLRASVADFELTLVLGPVITFQAFDWISWFYFSACWFGMFLTALDCVFCVLMQKEKF